MRLEHQSPICVRVCAGLITLCWCATSDGAAEIWGTSNTNNILRFDAQRNYFGAFPAAVNELGVVGNEVWATGGGTAVLRFDFNHNYLGSFTSPDGAGDIAAVGNEAWIVLANTVDRFDFSHNYLGSFNAPVGEIGVVGNEVWGMGGTGNIVRFDFNHQLLGTIANANGAREVEVVGTEAWVTSGANIVTRFDFAGNVLGSFNLAASDLVTVGDEVWATGGNTGIMRFDYAGNFLGSFSAPTDPPSGIYEMAVVPIPEPTSIALLALAGTGLLARRGRRASACAEALARPHFNPGSESQIAD